MISCVSIMFLLNVFQKIRDTGRGLLIRLMTVGVVVALHWIAFFGSIKLANASVALVCLATTAFFTSLIEPIITKQPFKVYEIVLGLAMVPGMALVVKGIPAGMHTGIWVGLLSAILLATFASCNKQLIHRADPMFITFVELGSGGLFISLFLPFFVFAGIKFLPQGIDWVYLISLAILCTTLGYVLALKAMKYLSAFISMLTLNLEPVYGIILAYFLLNDASELTNSFYLGVAVILVTIFAYPFLKRRYSS